MEIVSKLASTPKENTGLLIPSVSETFMDQRIQCSFDLSNESTVPTKVRQSLIFFQAFGVNHLEPGMKKHGKSSVNLLS